MQAKTAQEEHVYKGRLGRTSKTSVLISSQEGPVFPASVYTGLNVSEDPELREKLLEGSLNQVQSPFSERTYELAIPVRYHDEARQIFALVIPEVLRHEEFKHRSELLQEMAREREVLPGYVKNFHTIFDADALAALEAAISAADSAPAHTDHAAETAGPNEATVISATPLPAPPAISSEERERTERERQELERLREELSVKEAQLSDVSGRLERERERMEEVEMEIAHDRQQLEREQLELESARQQLEGARKDVERERQQNEATRLNLTQREIDISQHGGSSPEHDEKTQVVTDDQFIEIMEEEEEPEPEFLLDEKEILEEHSDILTSAPTAHLLAEAALPQELSEDEFDHEDATHITQVPDLDAVHVSSTFDDALAASQDYYTHVVDGVVVAAWKTSKKAVDRVLDGDPELFLQYAEIQESPLISILLATLNPDLKLEHSFGWPLDITHAQDRATIDALTSDAAVRFAFYDRKGKLIRTFNASAQLEENMQWIKQKAEAQSASSSGMFGQATEVFFSEDYERLGSMRHNFNKDSFSDLTLPSGIKLAAGIVGYWSGGDVFDYLIGTRSFPLVDFRAIQKRVVTAALEYGIYLNAALREVALSAHMVDNERALARRLLANCAELSVGLKNNDLDPLEQWENWDALLGLADEVGVQPDSDVIELAQGALRRAQEFQEHGEEPGERTQITRIPVEAAPKLPKLPGPPTFNLSAGMDDLVVARRSETTGVTYYLPDDAVLDQFDDMNEMSKDDLLLLLDDSNGRLEAAQMLLERFGSKAAQQVLAASEEMMASEVAALARFLETRADGMEAELVRSVEAGGPSATYIATHALMNIKSTSAIPTLLEALRDKKRQGNLSALAGTLAGYGEKLVPALTRTIKSKGHDDAIVLLLKRLGEQDAELLSRLLKDRNRRVREAAKQAKG